MTFKKFSAYLAIALFLFVAAFFLFGNISDNADKRLENEGELNNDVMKINERHEPR
jgi:hypothetical protein